MKRSTTPPNWAQVRKKLDALPRADLERALQMVFSKIEASRSVIDAVADQAVKDAATKVPPEKALKPLRRRVDVAFFGRGPIPSDGHPRLADARRIITNYEKSVGNLIGSLDLKVSYLEAGTSFTIEFGDIDEGFYGSLIHMLYELEEQLTSPVGLPLLPRFMPRLSELREQGSEIGWGYGDGLSEVVGKLEDAASKLGE